MGKMTNFGLGTVDSGLEALRFDFFDEATEKIDAMESMLLALDQYPQADETLNAVFRVAHSIKGGAAAFGFADVTALTHDMETLLDRLRQHEATLRPEVIDALLQSGDVLRQLLARHRDGVDAIVDVHALSAWLKTLASGVGLTGSSAGAVGVRTLLLTLGPLVDADAVDGVVQLFRDIRTLGLIEAVDDGGPSDCRYRQFKIVTASPETELIDLFSFHASVGQISLAPWSDGGVDVHVTGELTRADATDGSADGVTQSTAGLVVGTHVAGRGTLRVSVEKIELLLTLVGELEMIRSELGQQTQSFDPVRSEPLVAGLAELERITRHLKASAMSIRMTPMSAVFSRFPRMIRDLAVRLGKQFDLQIVGESTELDRALVDRISDPLTHLVRNSADHGIETPSERIAAGKPLRGRIVMSAAHQGDSILIEVADDGAGLSRRRILDKARSRGLPVRDDMTDAEVWALIWKSGFSTAEALSEVSGRGVGMDVVKRNISDLGGSVELHSVEGRGTRVSIRLPRTFAGGCITPAT
jgi:two-component system chemotaxis sensor kinase CheA